MGVGVLGVRSIGSILLGVMSCRSIGFFLESCQKNKTPTTHTVRGKNSMMKHPKTPKLCYSKIRSNGVYEYWVAVK